MQEGSSVPAARGPDVRVLLGLAALAAAVRLPGMGYGLWVDEVATVTTFVQLPLAEILTSYLTPNNHILNSALAHVSIGVFGETAWAVRLPAFLFGLASVPALYLLARQALTRAEAVGAALILALSYHHAYFSQNARGYTGYIFFTIVGTHLLWRGLHEGRRSAWAGFAVAGALNVYVLLSGLFAVVAQVCGALLVHVLPAGEQRRTRLRSLVTWTAAAAAGTLLLYAPVMRELIAFYTTAEGGEVGWRISENLLGVILGVTLPTRNPLLIGTGLVLGLPVLVAGAVRLWRRLPLVWFAFLLPPAIELSVTLLLGAGSYPRRFIIVLPLGALWGVTGVHAVAEAVARRVGPRALMPLFAAGVAAGVVAVSAGLPRLYATPKQDFEGALAWIAERSGPDDVVVGVSVASPPTSYYDATARSVRTVEELEAVVAEGGTVWLVTTFLGDMARFEPELLAAIEAGFERLERLPGIVGDGDVTIWRTRP